MAFENVLVEIRGRVGLITLNRPKSLNALNTPLIRELTAALADFATDGNIGAVVITGSGQAFAAGADIKEMQSLNLVDAYLRDQAAELERIAAFRKPIIAAVAGYCLGGGCELAMLCDVIIAADTARFGQPEISLGIIPGMGGTQRLPRAIGKSKAMEMILTGRMMDASEAERTGLAARVVPAASLVDEALMVAEKIASFSLPATMMAKEAVARAFEMPLAEGLRFEKRLFHALFASEDQKEGMAAFAAKRAPVFKNR
jgi:enoyl-CoA hydratase